MSKYESSLIGDFEQILDCIESSILSSGLGATKEGESYFGSDNFRCAVQVFERYSSFVGSRVSLNITLIETAGQIYLSAITAGSSRSFVLKADHVSDDAFMNILMDTVEGFIS